MKKPYKKQRRKPKQARSLATYNAVLDACSHILANKDYSQLTITEITLETGFPYATVYQYFESKEDIMVAWVERLIDQVSIEVLTQTQNMNLIDVETYSEELIKRTLEIISLNRESIRNMLSVMSFEFTSSLLTAVENKAIDIVNTILGGFTNDDTEDNPDKYRLIVLTRAVSGYIQRTVLIQNLELNIDTDAKELAILIRAYMSA